MILHAYFNLSEPIHKIQFNVRYPVIRRICTYHIQCPPAPQAVTVKGLQTRARSCKEALNRHTSTFSALTLTLALLHLLHNAQRSEGPL